MVAVVGLDRLRQLGLLDVDLPARHRLVGGVGEAGRHLDLHLGRVLGVLLVGHAHVQAGEAARGRLRRAGGSRGPARRRAAASVSAVTAAMVSRFTGVLLRLRMVSGGGVAAPEPGGPRPASAAATQPARRGEQDGRTRGRARAQRRSPRARLAAGARARTSGALAGVAAGHQRQAQQQRRRQVGQGLADASSARPRQPGRPPAAPAARGGCARASPDRHLDLGRRRRRTR